MELNNEAVILLRTPTPGGAPANSNPPEWKPPTISFLTGPRWYPVLSSLPASRYARTPPRNADFQLRISPSFHTYTATETWIDPEDKPDPLEVEVRPRTSSVTGKVLDTSSGASGNDSHIEVSRFEDAAGRGWEVIAWGKQGQLADWMREDESGYICDPSGEGRPDWRNHYAVAYFHATDAEEAGVEVWDSTAPYRRLTELTFAKIRKAIRASGDEEFAKLADKLVEVPVL